MKTLLTICMLAISTVCFAQDVDCTDISLPNSDSGLNANITPPTCSEAAGWNIVVDTPTEQATDTFKVNYTKDGKPGTLVAEVTCPAGEDKKMKAKRLEAALKTASVGQGSPIDVGRSNHVITMTGNGDTKITGVDVDNKTKQKENGNKEISGTYPTLGSRYGMSVWMRCAGRATSYSGLGYKSCIVTGWDGAKIEIPLLPGEDLYTIFDNVQEHLWNKYGAAAWSGMDTEGGHWIIYNVPRPRTNDITEGMSLFGCTDLGLDNRAFTQPPCLLLVGGVYSINGFTIWITNGWSLANLSAMGGLYWYWIPWVIWYIDPDEALPHYSLL